MPDKFTLAQQFAETYPQAAARALEELATGSASNFIDAVPDKNSAGILASMLPYYAAKCVSQLAPETAGRYLTELEPRDIASILRHTPVDKRRAVLDALPRRLAPRVTIILNYSLSMIGAWLEPAVLTLPMDCTVGEAKTRLENEGYINFHRIYVVDEALILKGFVRLVALIQEKDETPLHHCLEPLNRVLRGATGLEMALEDTAWLDSDYLPVIDRRGQFIGILRYAELRKAVTRPRPVAAEQDISGGFMDLAESCYLGLADVMNTSLAVDRDSDSAGAR